MILDVKNMLWKTSKFILKIDSGRPAMTPKHPFRAIFLTYLKAKFLCFLFNNVHCC